MLQKLRNAFGARSHLAPPAPPPEFVEITYLGRRILLDPAHGSDLVAKQFAAGSYEDPLPSVLSACVRHRSGVFLDVGANNGLYSIIAASVDPGVVVRAFEPYPPVLEILRRNLQLNGLAGRVTVEPIALGAESGVVKLHIPSDAHGLLETSCSLEADFQPTAATVDVRVQRLDDVIGAEAPTVIKADIEGHESKFMEGARRTIEKHRPIVFYEMLGGVPHKEREITGFKNAVGYVDYRLRPEVAILSADVVFDGEAWNHALVPQEVDPAFAWLLSGCGLRREAP